MDFGKIFTKAWDVFWKHKILWVFGILSGSVGGIFGYWYNLQFDYEPLLNFNPGESPFPQDVLPWLNWGLENMALFVFLVILAVLLYLVVILFVSAFCTTALIKGILLAEESAEKLTFGEVASAVRPYFWRIFGLNALLGVGGMSLMLVLVFIIFALSVITLGIGMLCFMPLICILIPFGWFLAIVVTQANVVIVAENLAIMESIVRGWKLVTRKIGPYLLVWLITMVISVVFSFVSSLPSLIASLPMYGTMFSPTYIDDPTIILQNMGDQVKWSMIWFPIQIALMGIYGTFSMSVWVQTYLAARENGTLETSDDPEKIDPELLEQTT